MQTRQCTDARTHARAALREETVFVLGAPAGEHAVRRGLRL